MEWILQKATEVAWGLAVNIIIHDAQTPGENGPTQTPVGTPKTLFIEVVKKTLNLPQNRKRDV